MTSYCGYLLIEKQKKSLPQVLEFSDTRKGKLDLMIFMYETIHKPLVENYLSTGETKSYVYNWGNIAVDKVIGFFDDLISKYRNNIITEQESTDLYKELKDIVGELVYWQEGYFYTLSLTINNNAWVEAEMGSGESYDVTTVVTIYNHSLNQITYVEFEGTYSSYNGYQTDSFRSVKPILTTLYTFD